MLHRCSLGQLTPCKLVLRTSLTLLFTLNFFLFFSASASMYCTSSSTVPLPLLFSESARVSHTTLWSPAPNGSVVPPVKPSPRCDVLSENALSPVGVTAVDQQQPFSPTSPTSDNQQYYRGGYFGDSPSVETPVSSSTSCYFCNRYFEIIEIE